MAGLPFSIKYLNIIWRGTFYRTLIINSLRARHIDGVTVIIISKFSKNMLNFSFVCEVCRSGTAKTIHGRSPFFWITKAARSAWKLQLMISTYDCHILNVYHNLWRFSDDGFFHFRKRVQSFHWKPVFLDNTNYSCYSFCVNNIGYCFVTKKWNKKLSDSIEHKIPRNLVIDKNETQPLD